MKLYYKETLEHVVSLLLENSLSRNEIKKSRKITERMMQLIEERIKPIHFHDFIIKRRGEEFELLTRKRTKGEWQVVGIKQARTLEECRALLPEGQWLEKQVTEQGERWTAPDPDLTGLYWVHWDQLSFEI